MLTTLKSYVHVFTVTGLIAGIYGVPEYSNQYLKHLLQRMAYLQTVQINNR